MTPRLKQQYVDEIRPAMKQEHAIKNLMAVPKLAKVVINMGVGEAAAEPRALEEAMAQLALITGQKAAIRKARRSIAAFKLREGSTNACMVTLRGDRMYEFVDRLFSVAMPRIRDFRGVSPKSFDNQGNYTLGLKEQTVFPEVDLDDVERVRGMNITFVFDNSANTDWNRDLLKRLGMPFRN